MDRGSTRVSLLFLEIELIQTALTVVEMEFCKDSPRNVESLRVLREKLLAASKKASAERP
jgi:hypothetical protein